MQVKYSFAYVLLHSAALHFGSKDLWHIGDHEGFYMRSGKIPSCLLCDFPALNTVRVGYRFLAKSLQEVKVRKTLNSIAKVKRLHRN
jgi:hypothetical protein